MVRERGKRNVKSTAFSFLLHLLPFDESNYRPVSVDRSRQQPRDHTEVRSVGRHVESVATRSYSCSHCSTQMYVPERTVINKQVLQILGQQAANYEVVSTSVL